MADMDVSDIPRLVDAWNKREKAKAIFTVSGPADHQIAKASDVWEGNLHGEQIQRIIVYLRSSGCRFALMTGGCTTCAHALQQTTFGQPIAAEDYVQQFRAEYEAKGPENFPVVCIYNEGNMF